MTEYDIKRGHWKAIEGDKLAELIEEHFGVKAKKVGKGYQAKYGALKELNAELVGKTTLVVTTKSDLEVSEDVVADTNTRFRAFLLGGTGYTTKQRRDRMKKRAAAAE